MTDIYYYPKIHEDDDGVISVEITRTPRWKESELSGDEWRFSLIGTITYKDWQNGGAATTEIGGYNLTDVAIRVAAWLNENRSRLLLPPHSVREFNELRVCFQPGCVREPENIYAIRQEWTNHPYQGRRMDSPALGQSVRGFCAKHSHRGDCGLEDNDDNYELLAFIPRELAPVGDEE